jgi:hypothetical protein
MPIVDQAFVPDLAPDSPLQIRIVYSSSPTYPQLDPDGNYSYCSQGSRDFNYSSFSETLHTRVQYSYCF